MPLESKDLSFYPFSCDYLTCSSLFVSWMKSSTLASRFLYQACKCHSWTYRYYWTSWSPAQLGSSHRPTVLRTSFPFSAVRASCVPSCKKPSVTRGVSSSSCSASYQVLSLPATKVSSVCVFSCCPGPEGGMIGILPEFGPDWSVMALTGLLPPFWLPVVHLLPWTVSHSDLLKMKPYSLSLLKLFFDLLLLTRHCLRLLAWTLFPYLLCLEHSFLILLWLISLHRSVLV